MKEPKVDRARWKLVDELSELHDNDAVLIHVGQFLVDVMDILEQTEAQIPIVQAYNIVKAYNRK